MAGLQLHDEIPSTDVTVNISCRNLMKMTKQSKIDPMAVLFVENEMQEFVEFGRTECIKNSINPAFVASFVISYRFEECQRLRFQVYNVDSHSASLDKHDFLGQMNCTLAEILSEGGKIEKPLEGIKANHPKSTIIVNAEEVNPCNDLITLSFCGKNLQKKDLFYKPDPFLLIYRLNVEGSYVAIHKTEVVNKTLNPIWKEFTIDAQLLCNGDYTRSIKVECYDKNKDEGHDLIGTCYFVLCELTPQSMPASFECINLNKIGNKKGYENSGEIQILNYTIVERPSFLDYIRGGMQVNFTVGIDFTASNGNPRHLDSLHYNCIGQENLYMKALKAVGEVCEQYDSDKLFPALGFGGRFANGLVSHEFPLNGNFTDPNCSGIKGVLDAYMHSLNTVQLYGPTNFAPIIKNVARFATEAHRTPGSSYHVLLMLTDGSISDMAVTKEAIVNASHLPMSIIIVGIGNANFTAMETLDGDEKRLEFRGRLAVRDIVQFVPFNKFLVNNAVTRHSTMELSKEVLAEIPEQILSYMRMYNVKPNMQRNLLMNCVPDAPPFIPSMQ